MKRYPKYTWVGSRITVEDMTELYRMKNSEHVPITQLVAQAVREFIRKRQRFTEEKACSETQRTFSNN